MRPKRIAWREEMEAFADQIVAQRLSESDERYRACHEAHVNCLNDLTHCRKEANTLREAMAVKDEEIATLKAENQRLVDALFRAGKETLDLCMYLRDTLIVRGGK